MTLPPLLALALLVSPADPAERALPLLYKAAAGHVDQKTCFACHNQAFPMLAFATAKARGLEVPAEAVAAQTEHIARFVASNLERFRKGEGTGGQVDTAGYALFTLELGGYPADENTEAVVEYLLKTQGGRDHWRSTSNRPPTEASSFTATYLALRGLRHYGTKEQQARGARRVEAARAWLVATPPRDTEDRVFRLFGLKEAGASAKEVAAAAWDLLKTQHDDGGWGQVDDMLPDAYATATALVALHQAGGLATDHPAYVRGVTFLVRDQRPDGSWYVLSRSKPFQPYYETGFPYRHDQFIAVATSGWATTALLLARPAR